MAEPCVNLIKYANNLDLRPLYWCGDKVYVLGSYADSGMVSIGTLDMVYRLLYVFQPLSLTATRCMNLISFSGVASASSVFVYIQG